jgi:predicted RNase H-like HicB family nuclease
MIVKVDVKEHPVFIKGVINNFVIFKHEWDLDDPTSHGATLEEALNNFKDNYEEDIEIEIVSTEIYG